MIGGEGGFNQAE